MKLTDLEIYNPITIQCHDNPDADAIGSGYGLYCYFKEKGKDVRLIYSGYSQISKTNLQLMIDTLNIPIEYIPIDQAMYINGLLITVDCQYGGGNVTMLQADYVAVIDHHPKETDVELRRIHSSLGSCATLVWSMLRESGYLVDEDEAVGTALYYALYMDTNQFAELVNPFDMDMRESVMINKRLMTRYRNANISLQELEIAGIAMIRSNYNIDYRFAVIKSNPCDANLLGLLSDFLLQVAEVDTCAVYSEGDDGFKLSVRSCIKEVNANELAVFLTEGIGSGGGHFEKAGGFISKKLYDEKYPTLHSEAYFNNRMTEYFDTFEIIYARDVELEMEEFSEYRRRQYLVSYLSLDDLVRRGTKVSLRSYTGNRELVAGKGIHIVMEQDGSVQAMSRKHFEKCMEHSVRTMPIDYCDNMEYVPNIKDLQEGSTYLLPDYVEMAIPNNEYRVYAKRLNKSVKLFPEWDDDKYMLGLPGDYLIVNEDDHHDILIEKAENFIKKYKKVY